MAEKMKSNEVIERFKGKQGRENKHFKKQSSFKSNIFKYYIYVLTSKYSAEYFKKKHIKKQSRIQFSLFKIRTV